jgi:hypothetical protein
MLRNSSSTSIPRRRGTLPARQLAFLALPLALATQLQAGTTAAQEGEEKPKITPAAGEVATAPEPTVGLRAFIDPETGALLDTPTPEQAEALRALNDLLMSVPGTPTQAPEARVGGWIVAPVDRSYYAALAAMIDPDNGSVETRCHQGDAPAELDSHPHSATPLVSVPEAAPGVSSSAAGTMDEATRAALIAAGEM